MSTTVFFDVLIVYAGRLARSAHGKGAAPFALKGPHANRNMTYAYFMKEAEKRGLSVAFSSSDDIVAPGMCSSYWTVSQGNWRKHRTECYSTQIFDKCAPLNATQKKRRELLFGDTNIQPFTNQKLVKLFLDKLATFTKLPNMAIPTVGISGRSEVAVRSALKKLQLIVSEVPHPEDFGPDFILKDRFGYGGELIFKVAASTAVSDITKLLTDNPDTSFILQPFVQFEHGFSLSQEHRATDIRIIYMGSTRIHSYTRTAKKGDFRCNMHQGGSIDYIDWEQLPPSLLEHADATAEKLHAPHALYAIDFIVADSGTTYLLEGNTSPGLDWYPGNTADEKNAHELISVILTELQRRVSVQKPILRYTRAHIMPATQRVSTYGTSI